MFQENTRIARDMERATDSAAGGSVLFMFDGSNTLTPSSFLRFTGGGLISRSMIPSVEPRHILDIQAKFLALERR
jgi:hypothetical protein